MIKVYVHNTEDWIGEMWVEYNTIAIVRFVDVKLMQFYENHFDLEKWTEIGEL